MIGDVPLGALDNRLLQAGGRNTQWGPGVGRSLSYRLDLGVGRCSPDGVGSRQGRM